jgi:hypothetical protein
MQVPAAIWQLKYAEAGGKWPSSLNGEGFLATVSGLKPGTTYDFKARRGMLTPPAEEAISNQPDCAILHAASFDRKIMVPRLLTQQNDKRSGARMKVLFFLLDDAAASLSLVFIAQSASPDRETDSKIVDPTKFLEVLPRSYLQIVRVQPLPLIERQ